MIPKKIHYCWFGNNPKPYILKKCIKTWKEKCPDYEIIEWNETNFDINSIPFIKDAYEAKKWAFVTDYARLKIIYDNGGIYLDTDVELLKNLDDLLNADCYLAVQQDGKTIATGLGFGAKKNSEVVKLMLEEYKNLKFEVEKMNEIACPLLNTKALTKIGYKYSEEIEKINEYNTLIYPPKYFDPIAPGNSENLLNKDSYSIHHYSATWYPLKTRIKRKIINLIGQEKINKIKRR